MSGDVGLNRDIGVASQAFESHPRRAWFWFTLIAGLLLGTTVATWWFLATPPDPLWMMMLSTVGLVLLILLLAGLGSAIFWPLHLLLALLVTATAWICTGEAALAWFSGRSFGLEFFGHLERGAIEIALLDYWPGVIGLAVMIVVAGLAAWKLSRSLYLPRSSLPILGFVVLLVLGCSYNSTAMLRFGHAWAHWQSMASHAELDKGRLNAWQALGVINELPPRKQALAVSTPARAKNLVLVYLESFSQGLLDHSRWPDLTPSLARLSSRFGWKAPVYSSGYVTIEGIANSQCGTLVPFHQGNDSLTNSSALAEQLPCLGDVLSAAGYHQVYLGGAELSFAGKGAFLEAHGFDELLGWEYWKQAGFKQRENSWGLSDVELLDQAKQQLRQLQQEGQPFNLTLLTIGTHLPGYKYSECEPYGDGEERFVNAINCTDQLIGRWVAELQQQSLLEDTLLVITADHGVFPNPEMKRLFGEMLDDRRVPLIIVDDQQPVGGVHRTGAATDLPETLLDLLQIDRNSNSLMGFSLLDEPRPPGYQFARFGDMDDQGSYVHNNMVRCREDPTDQQPDLPLQSCEKKELLEVLRAIASVYSQPDGKIRCKAPRPLQVKVNTGSPQVSFLLDDEEQTNGFTHMGRVFEQDKPAIYALGMHADGRILARNVYAPDEVARLHSNIRNHDNSLWVLALNLPGIDGLDELPAKFSNLENWVDHHGRGIVVFSETNGPIMVAEQVEQKLPLELTLRGELCHNLFAAGRMVEADQS